MGYLSPSDAHPLVPNLPVLAPCWGVLRGLNPGSAPRTPRLGRESWPTPPVPRVSIETEGTSGGVPDEEGMGGMEI